MNSRVLLVISLLSLISCSIIESDKPVVDITDGRPDSVPLDIAAIPDAIPQYEPWSASVNPKSYTVLGKEYHVLASNKGYKKQGIASWYGTKFHKKKTATGEDYDMFSMTAAHKTLPIPSYARVTNLDNQRSVVVKVNDRGPFHEHRIIDLSYAAAIKLGLEKEGTGFVEVKAVLFDETKTDEQALLVSKKIYIQAGAFGVQNNALSLQQKIALLRLTTSRIVSQVVAGQVMYKVQVGPITSVTEADKVIAELNKIGVVQSQFISE